MEDGRARVRFLESTRQELSRSAARVAFPEISGQSDLAEGGAAMAWPPPSGKKKPRYSY